MEQYVPVENSVSQIESSGEAVSARPALTILSMCLAVVVVIAGVAGLTVAIPTIGQELRATQSELQWIIDSYAIVLAALLLPAGALGDKFGRKRMMLVGWAVFVVATALTAATDDIGALIALRAISGAGAAMVFPGTLSTITNVIPSERRTQAIAAWTVSASLGGTIGSVGAGALIEAFWFGSIFLVTAVIGIVIAIMTAAFVPETSDPDDSNLDPIGSITSLIGIGMLTLGIIEGPIKGWSDPLVVAGLVVGAVGLVSFVLWELRTPRPLLDVRLFRLRGFSTGSLSIFLQFLAAFGFFFTASQFLAFVFDYSPLRIGLGLLPIGVTIPLGSVLAPKAIERFGRGVTGAGGLVALAAGGERDASAVADVLASGEGLERFERMLRAQGGNGEALPAAPDVAELRAPASGTLAFDDVREVGLAVRALGGGRAAAADTIDPAVGLVWRRVAGEHVDAGDVLAEVHHRGGRGLEEALARLERSLHRDESHSSESPPREPPLLLELIPPVGPTRS